MNRGSDSILSVYSDARAEYTKQLCVFLVPAYFQFFTELLEKAKEAMINEPKKALWQFQNYLNEIHDWNIQKVTNEINVIYTNCGCDYMEELLTAVFIAHTKVLTAIRLSANNKKVEINIPKVEHFLFKALCETSKLLWSSTYLFRDGIPGIEKQQNYRMIEQLINEGILQAVRGLVPVKSILKDFVSSDMDEGEQDEETEDKEEKEVKEEKPVIEEKHDTIPNNELAIPAPVTLNEPAPVTESVVPEQKVEEIVQQAPQTIVLDEKPGVRFGEFDTVFDTEHPLESDLVYDPKDGEEDDDIPALEISDEAGIPLADGLDFESLDEKNEQQEEENQTLGEGDYEEL